MMTQRTRTLLFAALLVLYVLPALAQWTRCTNLPAVYVNTEKNRPVNSKDYYVYCTLVYVDEQDQVTTYDSVQIRGRGNSTWSLPKKPYKIKFNEKQKFLGKGYAKAKKWTLLANAGDKTMLRNAVTSAMGQFTSLKFNPAYKFVDLFLNGAYLGTYQISDQVDVRPHRVNVVEQDYPITAESNITGGYLLEADGFQDGNYFKTNLRQVPVRIHYPDADEIAARQQSYIKTCVNQFERILFSNTFDDPSTGYRSLTDSASLLDWYICTEVSANIDGFYSAYFYKEQDDPHIYWGPLWDYDIAYNNDYRTWNEQRLRTTAYSLMADVGYGQPLRLWVNRMWEDEWFRKQVSRRYEQLLSNGLVDHLNATIDSLVTLLDASQQLNYQKWGINTLVYHETVLYSSYDQYVSDLRQFIADHTAWLSQEFANRKPVEPTPPFQPENYYYRIVNANTKKAMEFAGGMACQVTNEREHPSADWYIRSTPSGHFQLLCRDGLQALSDPTLGQTTATTNVGTQLAAATPDEDDPRQQWDFIPQGTDGYYNLLNIHTQHIANLSGGGSADGTPILSYTNDDRNGSSGNRLWLVTATATQVPDVVTGITPTAPIYYALGYNPVSQTLHFGADDPSSLRFQATVTNAAGRLVGRFRASESFVMTALPRGVYIVAWDENGRQRSVKFTKR